MEKQTRIKFWCRHCKQDWELLAVRGKRNNDRPDAWLAKCPECSLVMMRPIGDPMNDDYFRLSKVVRSERRLYEDFLLQPGDARFDKLYPQHKKQKEDYEQRQGKKTTDL